MIHTLIIPVCVQSHFFAITLSNFRNSVRNEGGGGTYHLPNSIKVTDAGAGVEGQACRVIRQAASSLVCSRVFDFLEAIRDHLLELRARADTFAKHRTVFAIPAFFQERLGDSTIVGEDSSPTRLTAGEMSALRYKTPKYTHSSVDPTHLRSCVVANVKEQIRGGDKQLLSLVHTRVMEINLLRGRDVPNLRDELDDPDTPSLGSLALYEQAMSDPLRVEYGGEFEINQLCKALQSPIMVFFFDPSADSPAQLVCEHLYGADLPGLPVLLGLLHPFANNACHYVLLVPKRLPGYHLERQACERLVEVHAPELLVQVGDNVMSCELFNPAGKGLCLFEAVSLAIISRRPEFQKGGANFKTVISRSVHLLQETKTAMQEFARLGFGIGLNKKS